MWLYFAQKHELHCVAETLNSYSLQMRRSAKRLPALFIYSLLTKFALRRVYKRVKYCITSNELNITLPS